MLFRFLKWFFTVFIFDTRKNSPKTACKRHLPKGSQIIDFDTGKRCEWDYVANKEYLL